MLGPPGEIVGHLSGHAAPGLGRPDVHLEPALVARIGRLLTGADALLLLLAVVALAVPLLPACAQVSAWLRWRRGRRAARGVLCRVTAAAGG